VLASRSHLLSSILNIPHYAQKKNKKDSWKEASDKKKNRNSPELIMSHKPKMDNYWTKQILYLTARSNSFDGFEEILDHINDNKEVEKAVKSFSIFVARVNNIVSAALSTTRRNRH